MSLSFPSNPTLGQTVVTGGTTWYWNGSSWSHVSSTIGPTGYAGSSGYFGSVGFTGSTGVGYAGSAGYVGSVGPANGYTGSAGVNGYTGSALNFYNINYSTLSYTGNGTSTTFALGATGYTENNIMVFQNGITQVPVTDYTVSGSNLIFTTAPASTEIIQIRLLAQSIAASAAAYSGSTGYTGSAGSGGGGGASGTSTVLEFANTISSSYSLTAAKNAMSVSPITMALNITFTVPNGQRWIII